MLREIGINIPGKRGGSHPILKVLTAFERKGKIWKQNNSDIGYFAFRPDSQFFRMRGGKNPNGLMNKGALTPLRIKAGADLDELQKEGIEIWSR